MKREADIQAEIMLAIGARPDCRVWRNNSGLYFTPQGNRVRASVKGAADILGILRGGRFLAIEVKSAAGQLRTEQERFRDMVTALGGLYVVARSVEDAVSAVDAALGAR